MKGIEVKFTHGKIVIEDTPEEFPLGSRGQRPVTFYLGYEDIALLKDYAIPGVTVRARSASCAWDVAPSICKYVGAPGLLDHELDKRLKATIPLPGLERYKALGFPSRRRDYQAEAILFLARRAYGVHGDPTRTGKTCAALGALAIVGVQKTLVICPSIAKYVWAAEVDKWWGEATVILFGRAGSEARVYCKPCHGYGEIREEGADPVQCKECKGKGEKIIHVRTLEIQCESDVYYVDTGKTKKNGSPKLQRRAARYSVWPAIFACPKHKDEIDSKERLCRKCKSVLDEALNAAPVIVANYDILQSQKDSTDRGVEFYRDDLPGWGPQLANYKFDAALLDECHKLRSFKSGKENQNRRERTDEVVWEIKRVLGLSATMQFGHPRDFWGQVDLLSKGLWS